MTNASTARRSLAAAVLLGFALTVFAPMAAYATEPPAPTATPSISSTPSPSTTPAAASSQKLELIVLKDVPIFTQAGGAGALVAMGYGGDHFKVLSQTPTPYDKGVSYEIATESGHGYLGDSQATVIPADGLAFDQPARIIDPSGSKDRLGIMSGSMGLEDLAIRTYPSREAPVIKLALPGETYQATKPIAGEETLYAKSKWVAVELADGSYGWLRAEGFVADDGTTPAVASPSTQSPSGIASARPTQSAASPAAVAPTETAKAGFLESKQGQIADSIAKNGMVIGLIAGAMLLIGLIALVTRRFRRPSVHKASLDPEVELLEEDTESTPPEPTQTPLATAPAANQEEINWDEED